MSTKRWLDDASGADAFARSILASGLDAEPPAKVEDEVWQRVLVAIPPPLGPGPGGGATATSGGTAALTKSATVWTLGKGFLLGVAASVAVAGVDRLAQAPKQVSEATVVTSGPTSPTAHARVEPTPVRTLPPVGETQAPTPRPDSTPAEPSDARRSSSPSRSLGATTLEAAPALAMQPSARPESSVATFPLADPAPSAARSRLDEEAALLQKARAELRAGSLAAAFATLEASRERFSAPELDQEREALLIELLTRSGQRDRARERARSFLARFPESPHAAAVRSFATSTP